jgi:AcrR family transcriptional regulator
VPEDKATTSKQRILDTAVKTFARKGYASTGVRELAENAGVNLAMINYCFGTKKELLKVILDTFFTGYLEIIEQELTPPGSVNEKLARFIRQAVGYIDEHRDYMIVTLTEMPHDDPDIIEHKARWARQAMQILQAEICIPLREEKGVTISPIAVGPMLIGMMSSRFLFAPVMEQVNPPGYGEEFFATYPDLVASIFINGLSNLSDNP